MKIPIYLIFHEFSILNFFLISRILKGSVIPRKIAGKSVQDAEIKEAGSYTFLYLFLMFISWLVFMSYGYGGVDSLFEISSAQGNVGLSVGITSPTMPSIPEILLIIVCGLEESKLFLHWFCLNRASIFSIDLNRFKT